MKYNLRDHLVHGVRCFQFVECTKKKKRQFAGLWVSRLNAAAHIHGMNYSSFRHLLKNNSILLNRKVLSQVAIRDQEAFTQLISLIKK